MASRRAWYISLPSTMLARSRVCQLKSNPRVGFEYTATDSPEGLGRVELEPGSYGPTLLVNGAMVGYVDLFPATEGRPPQILLFDEGREEPLVKVVLTPDGPRVVLHRDAVALPGGEAHGIHHGDRWLGFPEGDRR